MQKDELELAHHLIYHQGEEIRNQGGDIKELTRMVRIALDSAQAAKGAVVQVLADMTAMERGNSPYKMATDSRRTTAGTSAAASSIGPWRITPTGKREPRDPAGAPGRLQPVCKRAPAGPLGEPRTSTSRGHERRRRHGPTNLRDRRVPSRG